MGPTGAVAAQNKQDQALSPSQYAIVQVFGELNPRAVYVRA